MCSLVHSDNGAAAAAERQSSRKQEAQERSTIEERKCGTKDATSMKRHPPR